MSEPRAARPAPAAAKAGARWWRLVPPVQRDTTADPADFSDLAGDMGSTLRALEDLTDVLALQTACYGDGGRLRDDEGTDPDERLDLAVSALQELRRHLARAERGVEEFRSAIGHIDAELKDLDLAPSNSTEGWS